jgi:hypothetical protein
LKTYDTAYHQEPHHHVDGVHDSLRIFSNLTVDGNLSEEFAADGEVEDSTDADWAEESNECCMGQVLNLVDVLVHRKDDRHPADQQDQNA